MTHYTDYNNDNMDCDKMKVIIFSNFKAVLQNTKNKRKKMLLVQNEGQPMSKFRFASKSM
jgi:hypothetical protein